MAPLRRSKRLKAKATSTSEVDRFYTREKKPRDREPPSRLPSAADRDLDLQLVMSGILSDDSKLQLDSTTQLLNLVSVDNPNPMIDQVVQLGAVPRFVEFLKRDDYPQLQFKAILVLKNIAAANTQVVINSGAVPVFVKLLESSSHDLQTCEQVAWSLGNIAGESFSCCDVVLNCGALRPLLTLSEKHNNSLSFLRIATRTLTNIFETLTNISGGAPKVPLQQVLFAIRTFKSLLDLKDEEVLKEACWALFYITHYKNGIETTMYKDEDVAFKLADLFDHAPLIVLFPALRAMTSIVHGAYWNMDRRVLLLRGLCIGAMMRKDIHHFFKKDKRCHDQFEFEMQMLMPSFEKAVYMPHTEE
ncbi:importin subunit alpha-2-like isoform X2 [Salvia miltiorrhiza]|uniref:importin subunit alpha-2-like isoform X2 n=1 Tax=Salvia miltiorrhiza TaxID=226208 RepID=UPI0025ACB859|nr:importin subunit alpha-2-like isoform X2 [Salvia miltiorrhiza]